MDNKEDASQGPTSEQFNGSFICRLSHSPGNKDKCSRIIEKKEEYHQVNVEATKRLFEACRDFRVNRVVFASSAAVYGQSMKKIKSVGEESSPESPYAENKIAGEKLAMQLSSKNCVFTCFRFFNVFGPGQKHDSPYAAVIPIFIYRLTRGLPVTIFGDGKQTRDFIHISDVCNAIYEAAISKISKSEILNLGTGKSVSILDLAKLISEIVSEEGPEYRDNHEPVKERRCTAFKCRYQRFGQIHRRL